MYLSSGAQTDKRKLTIGPKRIVLGLSIVLTLCTLSTIGSVIASVVILKRNCLPLSHTEHVTSYHIS
jgi:hypothetical protein